MEDLSKDYLYQIMESLKGLCDAVSTTEARDIKSRLIDLQTDLNNLDNPRPEEE
tara:strand:+ start:15325 stop:15486 length:162 start_codon:yes stop_codon:yes gene_type:complete